MKKAHDCREELHAVGSRATPGRLALLQVLEKEPRPLTVAQLEEKLSMLNTVTLYRALDFLVSARLVRRGIDGRAAHYAYAGRPHHHHMTCIDCGFNSVCKTC
jgi:Fe2+ or Zn2+ uptake regulation protein